MSDFPLFACICHLACFKSRLFVSFRSLVTSLDRMRFSLCVSVFKNRTSSFSVLFFTLSDRCQKLRQKRSVLQAPANTIRTTTDNLLLTWTEDRRCADRSNKSTCITAASSDVIAHRANCRRPPCAPYPVQVVACNAQNCPK